MDLPQGQNDRQFWQTHVEQAKTFRGSKAAYCRKHNLVYDNFIYYKNRFSTPPESAAKVSGFTKVEVSSTVKPLPLPTLNLKNYPQLPDPK